MHVVATAGHVDHGKSTLVQALTGQDPDRLAEEHRRGLSIELGYVWTSLDGPGDVAFVDVPGHERFLSTTLVGLGPVRTVMLVVAADDPWMPQAAEHLAAIDAFDIRHGLLVVTRSDLADPGPALARAREQVDRSSLAGCPAVVVSSRTGEGLDRLRTELSVVLAKDDPTPRADVRLWVDRVFGVDGAGTVATGTLPAGTVRAGDQLVCDGSQVTVRGIETLGRAVARVSGPARVALRLGRTPTSLIRGSALLTPDRYAEVVELDVRLHGEARVPEQPLLHVGTAMVGVRARLLGDGHARLRLAHPLPLRHGDRVVLRDPGRRLLWGADIVDADPPPLARRGAARARAAELRSSTPGLAGELDRRGFARRSRLKRLGIDVVETPVGTLASGDWLVSRAQADTWASALVDAVRQAPDGLAPPAAARALGIPDPGLVGLLVQSPITRRGGRLVVIDDLPHELRVALESLRADLSARPFAAPDAERLASLGLDGRAVRRLAADGLLLAVGDGVVLLPGADAVAYDVLARLDQPFTTSEARRALNTTRRVVLPLLGHLDRTLRTRRLPDDRRCVIRNI